MCRGRGRSRGLSFLKNAVLGLGLGLTLTLTLKKDRPRTWLRPPGPPPPRPPFRPRPRPRPRVLRTPRASKLSIWGSRENSRMRTAHSHALSPEMIRNGELTSRRYEIICR